MTPVEFVRRAHNPFERMFDALVDPTRCERAMALLLAGYAAVWALYGAIAKSSQDIHFDMGELAAWSHEVTLGTPKHPPLAAWLVRLWFDAMPAEPWAYYLLAVILATVGLWIAWHVAARYLTAEKRVIGLVLLTFLPFYNFHALKFNANTVLIPFWAVTTWWFLRSLETLRAGWAILAGIGAAAAMLGKYWSIFLLAGLAITVLTDPRRGAYLRSPAPWLTILSGAIVLAPHVAWVASHHFVSFGYALESHPATLPMAALSAAGFIAGALGYIAVPVVFALVAAQPTAPAIKDTVWPAQPERRTIAIAFAAPLLLPALAAVPLKADIVSLWAMSAMTLLPCVLLSSPLVTITREAAVRLLAIATVFPLLMVAVAPAIAVIIYRNGVPNYATHYRLIAHATERAWAARTSAPLRIVGSYTNIVNGIVFYFPSQPSTYDIMSPAQTPWVDAARIKRDGIAIVCPRPEASCIEAMNAYAARYPGATADEVALARRYFGWRDKSVTYRILIVPPQ